jgi:CelD/BcsL family acetyltransferase involved in cellulose biosynthesis
MMTTITIDAHFNSKEWNDYLAADRRATVYHTLEWRSVLEDVFRYETAYVVSRGNEGDISGILPLALVRSRITGNRVVSLPFSQYGGPLCTNALALESMLNYLKELVTHGFEYIRLRGRDLYDELEGFGLRTSDDYSRCTIPIANRSDEDVWKALDKGSVRWAIKRSFSEGVVVEVSDSLYEEDRVTELMHQTTKKHGVPPYPPLLLKSISDLSTKGLAKIFLAKMKGKVIACLVLFTMNKEAIYAYNFSDVEYLRFYPNNALIWTAIKWSMKNGFSVFDMGTSSRQDN